MGNQAGDQALFEDRVPPSMPAYLDWDPDSVLDGWEVHRPVYAGLDVFRLGMIGA